MSLFAKAQAQATSVKVEHKDSLGGGFTFPSGLYRTGVKMMYLDQWASGALFVSLELSVLVDGAEKTYKENITISNAAGEFTYKDKKTGEDKPMPGYAVVDELLTHLTGKGFAQQTPEVKSVKVYDKNAQGEVPADREVFTEALRKTFHGGFLLTTVDKTEKNANWQPGMDKKLQYLPTGETREQNELHYLFNDDKATLVEVAAGKPAEFHKAWEERFAGKTINKAKGKAAGQSGATAGAPNQAQAGADASNPLFG